MKRVFICSGGPIEEVVEVKQLPFSIEETIKLCVEAGANIFVAGSAVYNAPDRAEALQAIKEAGLSVAGK